MLLLLYTEPRAVTSWLEDSRPYLYMYHDYGPSISRTLIEENTTNEGKVAGTLS